MGYANNSSLGVRQDNDIDWFIDSEDTECEDVWDDDEGS